ncbi:hypothetical protein V2A60_000300 [Cordyceps javanica]|uniref:GTP cyclohydrolase 1 n=1 Tax=Cordyceps javanica TaxID=43265 RepID=A0A545W2T4_9HYPO|nr:GTP cyclohydrolase I [Cordyceps javanica]TQW08303.1 GTP cyclohydrolase I [Cordyceps javanica]
MHKTRAVEKISEAVKLILVELGEDPSRDGLQKTPDRAAKAIMTLTSGNYLNPVAILQEAIFPREGRGLILVKDIAVYSLCEHHLLPFFGRVHVAYIPEESIVGLSKIPRVVKAFAQRLQIQERLTTQVARCIDEALRPRGVAVVIEATHLCMAMRGVEKETASTTTDCFLGQFERDDGARRDFWRAVGR